MNDYLKTIIKAKSLIKQLLNDPLYGEITFDDLTIRKPEDLHTNLPLGSLIAISVSEWFLTSNGCECIWQNYSQGVVLDNEGMYLHMLESLDKGMTVELLHKGA